VRALKSFFNPGSFARCVAVAAFSRLRASWRSSVRITSLILIVALLANSLGPDSAAQARPVPAASNAGVNAKITLGVAGAVGVVALIGVGVLVIIQQAHTVKGCVSDDPSGLRLHTQDGKTYVLLGATTNIKADTRIKVRGTKRKKINGITDQPSFVVEKLDKVYGSCSVAPVNP
jgi:hypothetical protein